MRETGAILVPTRTVVEDLMANIALVPDYAAAKIELVADIHAQAVTRAYEHGVTIAMGTDILLTGPDLPNTWGANGAEPGYLVKLGLSPLEAIEAATATAPLTLGPGAARATGRGLRRRRDHPGRRPGGRHRRARRPGPHHRCVGERAEGQGRGRLNACSRLHAQHEVDLVASGIP